MMMQIERPENGDPKLVADTFRESIKSNRCHPSKAYSRSAALGCTNSKGVAAINTR